jgi:diguanylate cyclase (GGDEF)-like protein
MAAQPLTVMNTADEQPAKQEKVRLLIVDDLADNRTILARRLERRGYDVTEADGGQAALDLIGSQSFDLVLLDIMMPDIDGLEVLKTIRQTHNSTALPVIMVTARAMGEDVVKALELGADDYVTKPVDFQVALARVNTQLARRKAEIEVIRAAQALRTTNEALEERVRQRTEDLVRINERLKLEINQRELSEAEIKHLAHHDALTGLANRMLFNVHLKEAVDGICAPGEGVTVMFVDLDGFKSVNDTMGHGVGDELLKKLADRMSRIATEAHTIARFGGDEFALMLRGPINSGAASNLAQRLINDISRPVIIDDCEVNVGSSIGIAIADSRDTDPDELLRNADLAMYRAKSEGRGIWRIYSPEMDAVQQSRRELEMEMRRALSLGEFELYFQPIIDIQKRRINSFETLLRWNHPERGMVSPAEFIAVAEETGLIIPLGEWVIRESCRLAVTWPGDIRVAVNLSSVQFLRGNVVNTIVSALGQAGLRPDRFEIEITESILLEKTDRTLAMLSQLRDLGVRISMDDFGTGYSSLSYLRSFQFDKIKIDRSFIIDLQNDPESRAIVSAITDLSSRFGLRTTAEGVETLDQLKFISGEGCTEVQGALFSMPVPAGEVSTLLDQINGRLQDEIKAPDADSAA